MALGVTLQKIALKLIQQYGIKTKYIKLVENEYDVEKGATSSREEEEIILFLMTYKSHEYIAGVIEAGDTPFITTKEVKKDSLIVIDGEEQTITQIEKIRINDFVVLFKGNLRLC